MVEEFTKLIDKYAELDETEKFYSVFFLMFSIFSFNRLNIGINSIIGVLIGLIGVRYYHLQNKRNREQKNVELLSKLETINEVVDTEVLYKDPDMINLLFKIFYYVQYNEKAYIELVQKIELVIKTVHFYNSNEIRQLGQGYQVFQGVPLYNEENDCRDRIKFINVLIEEIKEIFNGFVYSLPGRSDVIKQDFEKARYRLVLLLIRHKDILIEECKQKTLSLYSKQLDDGKVTGV